MLDKPYTTYRLSLSFSDGIQQLQAKDVVKGSVFTVDGIECRVIRSSYNRKLKRWLVKLAKPVVNITLANPSVLNEPIKL